MTSTTPAPRDPAAEAEIISAATSRAHRATWWVYGVPGDTTTRIRHSAAMRGQWGYDVTCSCGWDSRTGGGIRRYVADKLFDHRLDAQSEQVQL